MKTTIKILIVSVLCLYFYSCRSMSNSTANNDSEEIDLVENEYSTDRFTDAQMNYYEEEIKITEYE